MSNSKRLNLAQTSTIRTAIQSMIGRTCIISYGIVKDVPASGIVTVELSVAKSTKDIKVITCVLVNFASNAITIDIVPEKGDKVLVFFPDKFDSEMFSTKKTEAIIDQNASGYNLLSGLAVLMNQYKKNDHKNFIQFKSGEVTIENNKTKTKIDTNGDITIETEGKYTIKNNSTDLKTVMDGLATELNNLVTVGSPATQKTSPATQSLITKWKTEKLDMLFK